MLVEFNGMLDNLSSTTTDALVSITNLILTSLVPKIVVRVLKILANLRKLLGFTFVNVGMKYPRAIKKQIINIQYQS